MAVLWQLTNLAHCRGVCHVILGTWLPATSVSDPVQCLSINDVPWLFLAPDCTSGSNSRQDAAQGVCHHSVQVEKSLNLGECESQP